MVPRVDKPILNFQRRRESINQSSRLVLRAEPFGVVGGVVRCCGLSGLVLRVKPFGTAGFAGGQTGLRLASLRSVTRILLPEAF